MSIRVLAQIWDFGPEDRSELLVLLALADFANDEGECWPSMVGVAQKARMTERGAQKIVRRLEEDGWLKIDTGGGRGGKNRYRILAQNPEQETPNTKRGMEEKPRTAEHKPRTGVQETPNGGSPEPSVTIKEPSVKGRAREILASVIGEKAADDLIAHRRALKKPLTERAAELIAGRLVGCRDPVAVVNQSIMNGWQGVFPEKISGGRNDGAAADRARRAGERYAERRIACDVDRGPDRDPSQPLLPAR